mmetsp:Transcript_71750/g.214238  ORF Transcript_71750/g.214238 Transcript_71750/m.214238 type:complete len:446 (+) Transcript_71750:79-1416(+)
MFLSKDLFEDEPGPERARTPAGSRPSQGITRQFSNGSLAGGPGAGVEQGEEAATPSSAAGLRAKLLQQRQLQLARQRQTGLGAGGVRASVTAQEVATPMGKGANHTTLNRAFTEEASSPTAAELDDMEDEAKEDVANIVPEPPPSAEELARRRQQLLTGLGERGICQEYDPTEGESLRPAFKISSVAPHMLKDFLRNPAPREGGMLQCRVLRDRSGISNRLHPRYTMDSEDGLFLMTAQKQMKNKTAYYAISMSRTETSKGDESFLGKLRSDFLGTEWVAYGPGLNPAKADVRMPQHVREELLAVQFAASRWGSSPKGPQQMNVVMPHVMPSGERLACQTLNPQAEGLFALSKRADATQFVDLFRNKPPKWHEQKGAFVLNFNSRVTEASVKNFQLISSTDPEKVYLQFGRVGKEAFTIDFQHPISAFQAFAMCLSVFDFKLGCA